MEVWMMIKTLHRPFLDPLHHQNTRSSLLWSWGSVWTYRAQHCQWRQREREKLSEIPELSGIWKPPSDRSLAKLEPRVMEMFTFLSTLGAAWHSPSKLRLKQGNWATPSLLCLVLQRAVLQEDSAVQRELINRPDDRRVIWKFVDGEGRQEIHYHYNLYLMSVHMSWNMS